MLLNGRIVVAGEVEQTLRAQPGRTFRYAGVARYTADGHPDATLNADGDADGCVLVDLGGERAGRVSALLLDPFTGTMHLAAPPSRSTAPSTGPRSRACFPNGALDRSFGPPACSAAAASPISTIRAAPRSARSPAAATVR